jgi:hypothetical protein
MEGKSGAEKTVPAFWEREVPFPHGTSFPTGKSNNSNTVSRKLPGMSWIQLLLTNTRSMANHFIIEPHQASWLLTIVQAAMC